MPEKVSLFTETRKRSARGRAMEVINLELLTSIEPKRKGIVTPMKRKMESSTPMDGKLIADTMKSIRAPRRLAGLKAYTTGGSSSGPMGKVIQTSKMLENE